MAAIGSNLIKYEDGIFFVCTACDEYFPNEAVLLEHLITHCDQTLYIFDDNSSRAIELANLVVDTGLSTHRSSTSGQDCYTTTGEIQADPKCSVSCSNVNKIVEELGLTANGRPLEARCVPATTINDKVQILSAGTPNSPNTCCQLHSPEGLESLSWSDWIAEMCKNCYSNSRNFQLSHPKRSNSEDQSYKCQHCSFSATTRLDLTMHEMSHIGDKPYKCQYCSYSSTRGDHLKRHEVSHIDDKPYKSQYCPYSSTRRDLSKSHEMSHIDLEDNAGEKPHKCQHCPYTTKRLDTLKRHEKVHTESKLFKCQHCTYATARSDNLKKHERAFHAGQLLTKCQESSNSTTGMNHFKSQESIHIFERPYKCQKCSYSARKMTHLERHERTHTAERPHQGTSLLIPESLSNPAKRLKLDLYEKWTSPSAI